MNNLLKLLALTLLLGAASAVPNSGSDASAKANVVDEVKNDKKQEEPKKIEESKKHEEENDKKKEESEKVDEVKNDKKQEEPKKSEAKERVHNVAHPHANHKKENDLTKILNQSQAPYKGPVGEISASACCADKTDGNAVAAK